MGVGVEETVDEAGTEVGVEFRGIDTIAGKPGSVLNCFPVKVCSGMPFVVIGFSEDIDDGAELVTEVAAEVPFDGPLIPRSAYYDKIG